MASPTSTPDEPHQTALQFLAALRGPDYKTLRAFVAAPEQDLLFIPILLIWRVQQPDHVVAFQQHNQAPICTEPFQRAEIIKTVDVAPLAKRVLVRTYHAHGIGGMELEFEQHGDQWHITAFEYLSEGDPRLR